MITYEKRIQDCIDFIEAHLREDLPLREISGRANASLYHFHRLFRAFVGQSLGEYIRGRRLTHAARDLVDTRRPVLDIALDYQYSTPESFLRAFKALYGCTPRAFRKKGQLTSVHQKADLARLSTLLKEGIPMVPTICERNSSRLFGSLIHTRHGFCHEDVAAFWASARSDTHIEERARKAGARFVYGACFGTCDGCGASMEPGAERFAYVIGWEAGPGDSPPQGMVEMAIPAGTYAVFRLSSAEEARREEINGIYRSWLPQSGYELSDSPVLEKIGDASMELWLPVKRDGK